MIGIEADFDFADIERDMDGRLQEWFDGLGSEMMRAVKVLTDRAIAKPRAVEPGDGQGFGNVTYDLRSSMGCGLVVNKRVVETYFPFKKKDGGLAHGLAMLDRVALEVEEEIAVVMVAGEKYAKFVENKGYDVISLSFLTFDPEFMKGLSDG